MKQSMLTGSTAYWIAFGAHGPRAPENPTGEVWKVLGLSAIGIAISAVIFATIRYFARPAPKTMTREWQEMSNEYLRVCPRSPPPQAFPRSHVFTGIGASPC